LFIIFRYIFFLDILTVSLHSTIIQYYCPASVVRCTYIVILLLQYVMLLKPPSFWWRSPYGTRVAGGGTVLLLFTVSVWPCTSVRACTRLMCACAYVRACVCVYALAPATIIIIIRTAAAAAEIISRRCVRAWACTRRERVRPRTGVSV